MLIIDDIIIRKGIDKGHSKPIKPHNPSSNAVSLFITKAIIFQSRAVVSTGLVFPNLARIEDIVF